MSNLSDIRERLEVHVNACREALADGKVRPQLPDDRKRLRGANLAGSDFAEADLARTDFTEADLARTDFTEADLARTDFTEADLVGADFTRADVAGAYFGRANLAGVDFTGADVAGAYFGGANLAGVDFTGADVAGAYFGGANLTRARLGIFILASGIARTVSGGLYPAFTASSESGRLLRYGCVTLPVAEWRKRLGDLCRQHVPGDEARHEAEITALLAYCDALDAIDSMTAKKAEWGGA